MATTAIWGIKGNLGSVADYVSNPDKTANPEFVPQLIAEAMENEQALRDVISYTTRDEKTDRSHYVSGLNCDPDTVREDMMATKRRYGKLGGNVAYHGYQSFAPGEVTPDLAYEIGIKLAKELWGDRFEVIVATHLDKAHHIHNHFLLNSVSFADGGKYNDCKATYRLMRSTSDRFCREHSLSVIQNPKPGRTQHYAEWQAAQQGKPTYRGMIQADLDRAIAQAMTERQFFENLRAMGYSIKRGEDITVRAAGRDRGLKLQRNFGDDYSLAGIRRRILEQARPKRPEPEPTRKVRVFLLHGTFHQARRMKGFRALYFRYLYLLGKLPKHRQRPPEKVHPIYRGELIKIDQISRELRLLCEHEIDTPEQLAAFKKTASKKEAALCDRIENRVRDMRANLQSDKNERNEVKVHERRRRR